MQCMLLHLRPLSAGFLPDQHLPVIRARRKDVAELWVGTSDLPDWASVAGGIVSVRDSELEGLMNKGVGLCRVEVDQDDARTNGIGIAGRKAIERRALSATREATLKQSGQPHPEDL